MEDVDNSVPRDQSIDRAPNIKAQVLDFPLHCEEPELLPENDKLDEEGLFVGCLPYFVFGAIVVEDAAKLFVGYLVGVWEMDALSLTQHVIAFHLFIRADLIPPELVEQPFHLYNQVEDQHQDIHNQLKIPKDLDHVHRFYGEAQDIELPFDNG